VSGQRYRTLAELKAAYERGDGLTGPVYLRPDSADAYDGTGRVFRMSPETLLEQALTMAGIPWERTR
jgi:hypothetical protein